MILAPVFGTAMLIAVATGPIDDPMGITHLSPREKSAATQPLVRSATDCIVRAVFDNPRYTATGSANMGDLIVQSMPSCVAPVRAMIDAYDQYYGDGSGEDFFMGPYLDALPRLVVEAAKKAAAP
jgi:hypothetical protein